MLESDPGRNEDVQYSESLGNNNGVEDLGAKLATEQRQKNNEDQSFTLIDYLKEADDVEKPPSDCQFVFSLSPPHLSLPVDYLSFTDQSHHTKFGWIQTEMRYSKLNEIQWEKGSATTGK